MLKTVLQLNIFKFEIEIFCNIRNVCTVTFYKCNILAEQKYNFFKGVVDCDFTFLTLVCVMLLFEHKQYLQSYDTESSIQTEISSFKILSVQCLQKWQQMFLTVVYIFIKIKPIFKTVSFFLHCDHFHDKCVYFPQFFSAISIWWWLTLLTLKDRDSHPRLKITIVLKCFITFEPLILSECFKKCWYHIRYHICLIWILGGSVMYVNNNYIVHTDHFHFFLLHSLYFSLILCVVCESFAWFVFLLQKNLCNCFHY